MLTSKSSELDREIEVFEVQSNEIGYVAFIFDDQYFFMHALRPVNWCVVLIDRGQHAFITDQGVARPGPSSGHMK